MPEAKPKQTTARCRATRSRCWRPSKMRSPPCHGPALQRGKRHKETKRQAACRPRCHPPSQLGSSPTACDRTQPAWQGSSRQNHRPLTVAYRAARRTAVPGSHLSPRERTECRSTAKCFAQRGIAASASRTVHHELVRELRAPGHGRVLLIGRDFAQLLAFSKGHFAREVHVELAFRRTDQLGWICLLKGEVHEDRRIVDFDLQLFCLHRLLERQSEIQRK